jgi:anthranilate synthase component II
MDMLLLIDNYDSFSYNLYQLAGSCGAQIHVVRNDAVTIAEIREMDPECIILSPGPGRPEDAGICMDVIRSFGKRIPILGVCLGHQAICAAYGGKITYADHLMHGKQSKILISGKCPLFKNLDGSIYAARYHSLAVKEDTLPDELEITARSDDGEIMAVMHKEHPVFGVQFHPESIMTPDGRVLMKNFLTYVKKWRKTK